MRIPTIILALSITACDWPFDYSQELEWPGGAPENCGDGNLDPDEQRDDGNRLDGDDCSANCLEMPTRVLNATADVQALEVLPQNHRSTAANLVNHWT